MTRKQIVGLIIGVLVLGLLFSFIYRQIARPLSGGQVQNQQQQKTAVSEPAKKAPEPVTIDDVTLSIQDEVSADLSALDDEANGEVSEIQADSDSINNLGTSYDENSL